MPWNRCSIHAGITARIAVESLLVLGWNTHPANCLLPTASCQLTAAYCQLSTEMPVRSLPVNPDCGDNRSRLKSLSPERLSVVAQLRRMQ